MNLKKKKTLAAKSLKVGRERVVFLSPRIDEIKEAITKQDIKDLHNEGAIAVKEVKGRKKNEKRKRKRGQGKVKKKVKKNKKEYMAMTRKLRKYVSGLKGQGRVTSREAKEIRNKIRNREYKGKSQLKETLNVR